MFRLKEIHSTPGVIVNVVRLKMYLRLRTDEIGKNIEDRKFHVHGLKTVSEMSMYNL